MSAKNAELERVGSHFITDGYSREGFDREEVFFYFRAVWRGAPVKVTVEADRYRHSSGLSDWRIYATESRFIDPEANGERGEATTGTAKSALSELCAPLARAWIDGDEYRASYRAALGRAVLRKLDGNYAEGPTVEALQKFGGELEPAAVDVLRAALEAYRVYRRTVGEAEAAL